MRSSFIDSHNFTRK